MTSSEEAILKAIISTACDTYKNLSLVHLNNSDLGLASFEVKKNECTVFFPAVSGEICKEEEKNCGLYERATSVTFFPLIEENAISDPLKVVISIRSWSASLIALGKCILKVTKIAYFKKDVWHIDETFYGMLEKLSTYDGGTKICCGITNQEYDFVTKEGSVNLTNKRFYPGGSSVREAVNCEMIVSITKWTSLPNFPFHRCVCCQHWLQRQFKRKNDNLEEELMPDEISRIADNQSITRKIVKLEQQLGPDEISLIASNEPIDEQTITRKNEKLKKEFGPDEISLSASPEPIDKQTITSTTHSVKKYISSVSPCDVKSHRSIASLSGKLRKERLANLQRERKSNFAEIRRLRMKVSKLEVALAKTVH